MTEMMIGTEIEIYEDEPNPKAGLPEALRKQFMYPDEWTKEQEGVEVENEWLVAERDEVVEYVKTLKMLTVYLTGKTRISREKLMGDYFKKAEQNFPDYLRQQLEIRV